jgi:hypothetical protein
MTTQEIVSPTSQRMKRGTVEQINVEHVSAGTKTSARAYRSKPPLEAMYHHGIVTQEEHEAGTAWLASYDVAFGSGGIVPAYGARMGGGADPDRIARAMATWRDGCMSIGQHAETIHCYLAGRPIPGTELIPDLQQMTRRVAGACDNKHVTHRGRAIIQQAMRSLIG